MLSLVFVVFAGILNAIMDNVSHHLEHSIFKNWKYAHSDWTRKYIDGDPDKGRKKIFWIFAAPVFLFDLWHLAKFLMIIFFACSIVFFQPIFFWCLDIIILAETFSISFLFFYKFVFRKDKKTMINRLLINLHLK
jgi:hypothetical protein